MISISKRYAFDAAHKLHRDDWDLSKNKKNFGKCQRLHGHTYGLVVEVSGYVEPDTGMILNYFDLDKTMKPLVDSLDHRYLNDVFPNMLTTSENLVEKIVDMIKLAFTSDGIGFFVDRGGSEHGVRLHKVTLSETPKTTATWQA